MISLLNVNTIKSNYYKPVRTEPKNNRFISTPSVGDSFSFTGRTDAFSTIFNVFKNLKLSERELVLKCICEDVLGEGGHAKVYKIPIKGFEEFVLKKERVAYNVGSLGRVVDDFPNQNFGQPVAELGEGFSILKKVHGESLDKYQALGYNDVEEVTNKYYKMLAEVPQESYDGLVSQIKTVNENGYRFDPGSSGNIMINNDKFQIIDLYKCKRKNMMGDALYPFFYKLIYTNPEILESKNTVLTKLINATQKNNLTRVESDSQFNTFNYLLDRVDGAFKARLQSLSQVD